MTQNQAFEPAKTSSAAPRAPAPVPVPADSLAASEVSRGYGALQDVVCGVSVVLGTGRMSVRQCLYLTPRMVITLDQAAGADLHVHVNGIPVACGEVVIVEDSTALRLTRILAPPHAEGSA